MVVITNITLPKWFKNILKTDFRYAFHVNKVQLSMPKYSCALFSDNKTTSCLKLSQTSNPIKSFSKNYESAGINRSHSVTYLSTRIMYQQQQQRLSQEVKCGSRACRIITESGSIVHLTIWWQMSPVCSYPWHLSEIFWFPSSHCPLLHYTPTCFRFPTVWLWLFLISGPSHSLGDFAVRVLRFIEDGFAVVWGSLCSVLLY